MTKKKRFTFLQIIFSVFMVAIASMGLWFIVGGLRGLFPQFTPGWQIAVGFILLIISGYFGFGILSGRLKKK